MPVFPTTGCRPTHLSSSAPPPRSFMASSATPASPDASDDEGGGSSGVTSRCLVRSVYGVVSQLSEFKKQVIRDLGFGGLLYLPSIFKVNLKFSIWLLSRLDPTTSEIVLDENRRILVYEKDVGTVFGIPAGELDVCRADITSKGVEFLRYTLGLDRSSARSFKGLESVLQDQIDENSSRQEIDRFKIAFVIYVMVHLLAPSAKWDHGNIDFWGALKNADLIDRFNWCRYVYGHVLEDAQRVRECVSQNLPVTSISGCHLFLQSSRSL
uniref:Aminotransferase-like plant mobile domain-containing protein n=1 Tax=Arundo donax TaxID=35708 RepID=A0A0A9AN99_ARUDO